MQSAIVYGLTAALWGEITIDRGRVQQGNFNDYRMLRLAEMPQVEVHIVSSTDSQGGVGEPGTPPIAPAVWNAIFALTGKRGRELPIGKLPWPPPPSPAPRLSGPARAPASPFYLPRGP